MAGAGDVPQLPVPGWGGGTSPALKPLWGPPQAWRGFQPLEAISPLGALTDTLPGEGKTPNISSVVCIMVVSAHTK